MSGFVLGIGMSSKATADEVRELARRVLVQAGVAFDALALVATRERFDADDRLRIGPPVVGIPDAILLDRHPAPGRTAGLAARVAEGCALVAAGVSAELLVPTTRSAHATAALASPGPLPPTDTLARRRLALIGMGSGDPAQLTLQAVEVLQQVDVFFVVDKGPEKADLAALRTEICRRHRPDGGYRTVELRDPPRDRRPDDYGAAVRTWHDERAARYEQAIADALGEGECGAFLIWGDPAFYDSTIRIVDQITAAGRVGLDLEVVPGISSIQVLAARHRIPLNRIGEAVHITTGRRLAAGDVPDRGDLVIMLDGSCAFTTVTEDVDIFWGAYLGTPHERLIAGRLADVGDEIERTRAEARAAHGWIMDIYLLRRRA